MSPEDRKLRQEIDADLQLAAATRRVLYLEDLSDASLFFALLGIPEPSGSPVLHQGTLVVGLSENTLGRGNRAVRRRVRMIAGLRGYERIVGVVDGDGSPLVSLAAEFDPPFAGRLFRWKGYSIENLLVRAGWPTAWGPPPAWADVLLSYAPYAALNLLHSELLELLRGLGLDKYTVPTLSDPLWTPQDIEAALEQQRVHISGMNVSQVFSKHFMHAQAAVRSGLDEAHAFINGKWLVEDYAPRYTGKSREACRQEWTEDVRARGGLPEVREFWKRLTGRDP